MAVFIVSYDLLSPGQNYTALVNTLSRYDSFRAQQSTWLVNASTTSYGLRQTLGRLMDRNDKLIVSRMFTKQWATGNMPEAERWLRQRGL